MKTCNTCGVCKPYSEFPSRKTGSQDGYRNKCKECTNETRIKLRSNQEENDPNYRIEKRKRDRKIYSKKKEKGLLVTKKTDIRYPRTTKTIAREAVKAALQNGKLSRQPCEVCGCRQVQAHHDDYSKPLEVRWLCVVHHAELHIKLRENVLRSQIHD